MVIQRSRCCLYLPILSVALLTSVSSLSLISPRRAHVVWTSLHSAAGDDTYDDGSTDDNGLKLPKTSSSIKGVIIKPLEEAVRQVTLHKNYTFGDITKSVVDTTTNGVEDAMRAVTQSEDYQFGDLTKKVVGSSTEVFEDVVKSVTGKDDYKFGDITKETLKTAEGVLTYSEKTMGVMRDHNVHELVELLNLYWTGSMNFEERKEAFMVGVYLGAILVLCYNFVANAMLGLVFASAWTKVSITTGISPFLVWPKLLEMNSSLNLVFGGPCLPIRAIITIPVFFTYRKFVVGIASKSPFRNKFPIVNRCTSLLLSWVVANMAFVGGITFLLLQLLSLWTGVPVFPVAA